MVISNWRRSDGKEAASHRGTLTIGICERYGKTSLIEYLSSHADIKRNLIIFVTARLISPGGQPVNSNEEIEESEDVIEPPILPEVPFTKK